MAGLLGRSAMVDVRPPLLASGPRSGSRLLRLEGDVKLALASEQMLWPPSVMGPDRRFDPPTVLGLRHLSKSGSEPRQRL